MFKKEIAAKANVQGFPRRNMMLVGSLLSEIRTAQLVDSTDNFILGNRLGQERVAASFQYLVLCFCQGMGGKGYNDARFSLGAVFPVPYFAGALVTVHDRHFNIHEYQVKTMRAGLSETFFTIMGYSKVVRHVFKK